MEIKLKVERRENLFSMKNIFLGKEK